jgi:hypothetical protein
MYLRLFLGCKSADATLSVRHSKPFVGEQVPRVGRVWHDARIDSIALAGAELVSPDRMMLTASGPVVIDGTSGVVALDWNGQQRWRADGRKRGLGRITDLKLGRADSVVAIDGENGALLILAPDGTSRNLNLESTTFINALIPLSNGFVSVTADSARPLVAFGADGKLLAAREFPWPRFSSIATLARQGYSASADGNRWAYGFNLGDGFFVFDSLRVRSFTGHYIEPVAFPDVIVRPRRGGFSEELSRFVPSALSIALTDRDFVVLFGGTDVNVKAKVIDIYSATDGRYRYSMRLPKKGRSVVARDGKFYILTASSILVVNDAGHERSQRGLSMHER